MIKHLLVVLILLSSMGFAQESLQEIRRQIKAVEKETQQERDAFQGEKKRHQDFMENSRKKLSSMDEQTNVLHAQIDSLNSEAAQLEQSRQAVLGKSHWVEGRRQKYQESLARNLDSLAADVARDIPFRQDEAANNIREAAAQLRKGIVTPEEALGRAFDVLVERIQLGYTTENWSGYFAWNGRSIAGKFVRYGGVAGLFIAQDSDDIFWMLRGVNGYEWKPVGSNLALRTSLKETLKVAEGKSPPSLVLLPFAAQGPVQEASK